jgi:hypothetical protein
MYKICVKFKYSTLFNVHYTHRKHIVKDEHEKYNKLFKILYEHCDNSDHISYFNIREFECMFRNFLHTKMINNDLYKMEEFVYQGMYDMLQSQYKLFNQLTEGDIIFEIIVSEI